VLIEIVHQHMEALRADCASQADFHELRQGFIPPKHRAVVFAEYFTI